MNLDEPDAVLFDLDGTLLDTAPALARALNCVREENALAALPETGIRPYVSHGSVALTRLGFPDDEHTPRFESLRQRLLECYHNDVAYRTALFAGMPRVLAQIQSQALAWGIVTNKPGWLTEPLLKAVSLPVQPGCVLSGDSTPRAKPHPDGLLRAAEQLGVEPARCLYVGDAERDVAAARAAGMPVIVARYGYLTPSDQPELWRADAYIDEPLDLLTWLG